MQDVVVNLVHFEVPPASFYNLFVALQFHGYQCSTESQSCNRARMCPHLIGDRSRHWHCLMSFGIPQRNVSGSVYACPCSIPVFSSRRFYEIEIGNVRLLRMHISRAYLLSSRTLCLWPVLMRVCTRLCHDWSALRLDVHFHTRKAFF